MKKFCCLSALGALAFLYAASGIFRVPDMYDEGIMAAGAWRVLNGELPLRDFWTIYPPGQFLVVAAIFGFFGTSLLTLRLWDCVIRALLVVVVYLIARRITPSRLAFVPPVLVLLWVERFGSYGYPVFTGLLLNFLALYCATTAPLQPHGRALAAGLCIGLCCWLRIDLGAYGALSLLPVLWTAANSFRLILIGTAALLAGALAAFLAYLLPLGEAFDLLIGIPLTVFPSVRTLPFPGPLEIIQTGHPDLENQILLSIVYVYFPWLACLLALALFTRLRRSLDTSRRALYLGLVLLFLALFNQARVRSDMFHIFPLYVPSWLLWIWLVARILPKINHAERRAFATALALVPLLAFTLMPLKSKAVALFNQPDRIAAGSHAVPRAAFLPLPQETQQVISAIQNNSRPSERIFIGLDSYAAIDRNDIMLYFLAERLPATYYHELHPGIADTQTVQEALVKTLAEQEITTAVLYRPDITSAGEAERERFPLEMYVQKHMQVTKTFPHYTLLQRNR